MAEQIPLKAVKSSGAATALAEMAYGDYTAAAYLPPIFGDYISGMVMGYVGTNAISVSGGACYIPSLGYVLAFPSAITKSGLSLSASTWYHLYAYLNGSTPDIEVSTVDPAASYLGTARTKIGDSSRRYIGSITTSPSAAILQFIHVGTKIVYNRLFEAAPGRILAGGSSASTTFIDVSAIAAITATEVFIRLQNTESSTNFTIGNSDVNLMLYTGGSANMALPIALPADRNLCYRRVSDTSAPSLYIDVLSYEFKR